MRHLLDINVLIALMDPDHAFHARSHAWWAEAARSWATCPLTENGLLRIMTSSHYSRNTRFALSVLSGNQSLQWFIGVPNDGKRPIRPTSISESVQSV